MIVEVYSDSNISVYRSLSTDQKPLGCPHGSRLVEIDTQKKYIYDGMSSTWNESEESSGGGGQPVDAYTKEQTQALLATKVDKQTGMGLSQENYTSVEKEKLASLAPITYDQVPTSGSSNPVTSNGVYDAVAQKQDVINDIASIRAGASAGATALQQSDVTSTYASTGSAPANGKAIKEALDTLDVGSVGGAGSYIRSISETNGKVSSTPVNFDTALSSSSTDDNAPTSKTVYDDQQRQEVEIGVVANAGAKNIVNNTADASRLVQGITWTKNSDGSMSASGTSTSVSAIRVVGVQGQSSYEAAMPIPRGTYIISPSGFDVTKYRFVLGFFADAQSSRTTRQLYNEETTFTVDSDTARFDFSCAVAVAGETLDGETWYPMIRRAEITDNTYVPYAPSNRELYENVGAISDIGAKNLVLLNKQSSTVAGVQFVPDTTTGIVTATGASTSSSGSSTWIASSITLPPGNYIFSASESASWTTQDAYIMVGGTTIARDFNGLERFTITEPTAVNIYCRTRSAVSEAVFKPMIRRAEILDDTFVPYAPTNRSLYENVFGSGLKIPDSTNLNNLVAPGRHYTEDVAGSASIGNSPYTSGAFYVNVEVVNTDIIQTLWPNDVASSVMYRRTRHQSTWGSWFKFEGTVVTV